VADPVERSPPSRFGKLSPSRVIQHQIHTDWTEILLAQAYAAGDQGPDEVDKGSWGIIGGRNRLRLALDEKEKKNQGSERAVGKAITSFPTQEVSQEKKGIRSISGHEDDAAGCG
jgi:hypothetical protein